MWTIIKFKKQNLGLFKDDLKKKIGENVILENSVTIISDIKITSNCIIKISSIVNRSLFEENTYSSNILIKK